MLQNYGTGSWNYITKMYYGAVLQNYITELHYGIILPNYIMELYHGNFFMKRIPGIQGSPGSAQSILGPHEITGARDLGPPWDAPGTTWDHQGPAVTRHGPQKQPYLNKFTAPEAFDSCIRILFLQHFTPASPGTWQTALRTLLGCAQKTHHATLSCKLWK